MGQRLSGHEELDCLLLAMTSHDLKRAVHGVVGMLGAFSQEANREPFRDAAAERVADRIADMQHAAGDLLSGLDDILSTLDRANPVVGQLGAMVQCFERGPVVVPAGKSQAAARERWLSDLSDLPPHIRSM